MDNDKSQMMGAIAWKTLFGEGYEDIPDPNQPENVPRIKAIRQQKIDAFRKFADGPGKVLFEQWQNELRVGMFDLVVNDADPCNCKLSVKTKQLQYLLKLICKAQAVLDEK